MPRETDAKRRSGKMKFLCNYGGRILLRKSDGELRYVGGLTRVLAVDRYVSYSELMANLAEFCGFAATLRCQLPEGDLETLVSVKSDEELANLIEAYDEKASKESPSPAPALKIIAVLTPQAKDGTGTGIGCRGRTAHPRLDLGHPRGSGTVRENYIAAMAIPRCCLGYRALHIKYTAISAN
ncbi:hypothetical protein SAY86_013398 [Trapa natans]|uniref:PB1 domain-containing protein n=1 Tax=Trapa natans TaxID=22666 RepID=A0AAN7M178_TRANT|nr:hypothetical protein SAY86_013398 [Trapa natans]